VGAELLAPFAKWGALLVGVLLAGWLSVRAIRRGVGSAAVAKDDLGEARVSLEAQDKAREAMRVAPKTPRDLVAELKRRLHGPGGGKPAA